MYFDSTVREVCGREYSLPQTSREVKNFGRKEVKNDKKRTQHSRLFKSSLFVKIAT